MPHDRVGGAGGPVARNDDEARAGALPRRSDVANGPPPPPTRRAGPAGAAARRCSSSTAAYRLVSSSRLGTTRSVVRQRLPAQRGRGAFSNGAEHRAAPRRGRDIRGAPASPRARRSAGTPLFSPVDRDWQGPCKARLGVPIPHGWKTEEPAMSRMRAAAPAQMRPAHALCLAISLLAALSLTSGCAMLAPSPPRSAADGLRAAAKETKKQPEDQTPLVVRPRQAPS